MITDQCVLAPLFNQVTMGLLQPWSQRVVINGYIALFGGPRYSVIDDALRNQERAKLNTKNWWPLIIGGLGARGHHRRGHSNREETRCLVTSSGGCSTWCRSPFA
ncbi:MAG: hypothetical protein QM796_11905 [Chthoniobacteraceae bacterium]